MKNIVLNFFSSTSFNQDWLAFSCFKVVSKRLLLFEHFFWEEPVYTIQFYWDCRLLSKQIYNLYYFQDRKFLALLCLESKFSLKILIVFWVICQEFFLYIQAPDRTLNLEKSNLFQDFCIHNRELYMVLVLPF